MQLTLLIYQYYDELIRGLLSNSILYFQSLCIDIELVAGGEAYVEDPKEDWEEHTILISFKIHQLHNLLEMCLDPY